MINILQSRSSCHLLGDYGLFVDLSLSQPALFESISAGDPLDHTIMISSTSFDCAIWMKIERLLSLGTWMDMDE